VTNGIGVLIADDDKNVLDVLTALVGTDPELSVLATAHDAEGAIDSASQLRPDVALIDARMPGGGGIRAAREIQRRSPDTKVIALSAHEDPDTVISMLEAGAIGYVAKGDSTEEILRAIRRSTEGRATLSRSIAHNAAEALAEFHSYRLRAVPKHRRAAERIARALTGNVMTTVFQPLVDLRSGAVIGVEALSRFEMRPRRSPDQWFAEAGTVGLRTELEIAAVRNAVTSAHGLPCELSLFVNLSPDTLCSPQLRSAIDGAEIRSLVFELTEHAPVDDYRELLLNMDDLRAAGVRIAIDDVGAGFSSLRHVVRLRPDILKLDLALTKNVERDSVRAALVGTLLSFGREASALVVAEGIETQAQLRALQEIGVPIGQGFLLGRPGPMPDWTDDSVRWPGRHVFRPRATAGARHGVKAVASNGSA
jgi:EAL domain-containing protein (putative c-di-GMP-specific phosphodiesterase class I)/DNA-binding NarL/FixJ family response regulator